MSVSQDDERAKELLVRQLQDLPIRVRPMFGGYGLYLGDRYFGVIFDGRVYFRTDATTRDAYTSRGMSALQPSHRPRGPKTVDRNFEVPPDVLQDSAVLSAWALQASAAER
ncbi:MAG TPA: TfoX/Sxy family protein [Dehalococcoidia bacterium]